MNYGCRKEIAPLENKEIELKKAAAKGSKTEFSAKLKRSRMKSKSLNFLLS